MPTLLTELKRKASHRSKEACKMRFHVVVYSVTGAPRGGANATWTLSRSGHAFESGTAAQARGAVGHAARRRTRADACLRRLRRPNCVRP